MNRLQKNIIRDTEYLRPKPLYSTYPPYHEGLYMEDYFFNYFIENNININRIYIPIFWTSCYNNSWYDPNIKELDIQSYLDTLDPNLSYFTVCQHERAPIEKLPKNTIIFSSSGKITEHNKSRNIKPIPLVCSKIKNTILNEKRDILCSFVGANTHRIRVSLGEKLKNDNKYYFEMSGWDVNVPKHKEEEFKSITERSIFTLCPRGNGPTSFRLYEAMQLGSIPVYVYDSMWIPYSEELNWDDICVFIHENEITHIKDILGHISKEKIDNMREKIREIYDEYFTLESTCRKIIDTIKNERLKLYTIYSESHKELLDNYFLPSVKKYDEYELIIKDFDQICEGYYVCDNWGDAMTKKVELIIEAINENWYGYFVYSDIDIIFLNKTKDILINSIKNYDIVFQSDGKSCCAGFFICKCNEKTLKMWEIIKENIHKYNDDQMTLNNLISTFDIKYSTLPPTFFNVGHVNGFKRWDGKKDFKLIKNSVIFHANWTVGIKSKIELFNYIIDSENINYLKDFKIKDKNFHYIFDNESIFIGKIINGKMADNSDYYSKNNEISITDEKYEEAQSINIYYNYYLPKIEERKNEILYCYNKLLDNKKINNLYVLCSDELLKNVIDKVIRINFNGIQPTFEDYFNIINFNSSENDINIVLNSDCYIDEKNIELILKNIKKKQIYCLSRWDIVNTKPFKSSHYDMECSQDAWVKIGKFPEGIGKYKMGMPGCDNAIAYEFKNSGYDISNPSRDIKIYHYHKTNIRTYGSLNEEKEKNRVKSPYLFVYSSFLNEDDIKIKKVLFDGIVEKMPKIDSMGKTTFSSLNSFVDKVYVINLTRRKDRLKHIENEFERFNISFERFDAIDGQKLQEKNNAVRNAQIGCLRSHVGVIKKALKCGYNKIAIFEDDIILCDDFEERLKYYSEKVPDNWDIMYLGCNLNQCKFPIRIKPYIYKVLKSYGCFAMILNNNNDLFQKIIDITKDEGKPIDNYYHDDILKIANAYLFYPFFVKTLFIESDISSSKEKISYDIVNKHFMKFVKLPKLIQEVTAKRLSLPVLRIENEKNVRENCENYLRGILPFQIFYGNKVIFDSSSSDKINVNFFDDHFTLYGRVFSYRGMKIKNK